MPIIEWSDNYAIGNQVIDDQHKKIFIVLNKLYDSYMDNGCGKIYEIAVERLFSLSIEHFAVEERLMCEWGHSEYAEHVQEHKLFSQKVSQLHEMLGTANRERVRELIEYLSNWIIKHEIVRDSKIMGCCNSG